MAVSFVVVLLAAALAVGIWFYRSENV